MTKLLLKGLILLLFCCIKIPISSVYAASDSIPAGSCFVPFTPTPIPPSPRPSPTILPCSSPNICVDELFCSDNLHGTPASGYNCPDKCCLLPQTPTTAPSACIESIDEKTTLEVTTESGGTPGQAQCTTVLSLIQQLFDSSQLSVNNLSNNFNRQRISSITQDKYLEVQQDVRVNNSTTQQITFDKWNLFIGQDKISEGNSPVTTGLWLSENSFPSWIKGQVGNVKTTLQALFKINVSQQGAPSSIIQKVLSTLKLSQIPSETYNVKITVAQDEDYNFLCPYHCARYECPAGEIYQGGLKCEGVDIFCCQPASSGPTPTIFYPTLTPIPRPTITPYPDHSCCLPGQTCINSHGYGVWGCMFFQQTCDSCGTLPTPTPLPSYYYLCTSLGYYCGSTCQTGETPYLNNECSDFYQQPYCCVPSGFSPTPSVRPTTRPTIRPTNTPVPPTPTPTRTGWGVCGTCEGALPQYSGCTPLSNCKTFYQESICVGGTGGRWHAPCCLVDPSCSSNPPVTQCGYRDQHRICSRCQVLGGPPDYNCKWEPGCGNSPPDKPILKIPDGITLHRSSSSPNITLNWFAFSISGDPQWNKWGHICARGSYLISDEERYYFVFVKGPADGDFHQICAINNIPDSDHPDKTECTFDPGTSSGTFQWYVQASTIVSVSDHPFAQSSDYNISSFKLADYNLRATCNPEATRATLSWNSYPGVNDYALRINYMGDPWDGTCYSPGGDYCNDTVSATSFTFTVLPDQRFGWWIHPKYPNGVWAESPMSSEFICSTQAPTATNIPIPLTSTPTRIPPTLTPTLIPCGGVCGNLNSCGDPTGGKYHSECTRNSPLCASGAKCMAALDVISADWLCRNQSCPDEHSCICRIATPTFTPTPISARSVTLAPSLFPTLTPTPAPVGQCEFCRVYDLNWGTVTTLKKGLAVYFSTRGNVQTGSLATSYNTKARFRINGGADNTWCTGTGLTLDTVNGWCETTLRHNDEFYIPYVFRTSGRFTIKSMLFNDSVGWY